MAGLRWAGLALLLLLCVRLASRHRTVLADAWHRTWARWGRFWPVLAVGLATVAAAGYWFAGTGGAVLGAGMAVVAVVATDATVGRRRADLLARQLEQLLAELGVRHSVHGSLVRALAESTPQLAEPARGLLGGVWRRYRAGQPLSWALDRPEVANVPAWRLLLTAVEVDEMVGGPTGAVLGRIAELIHDRESLRREREAETAAGRLTLLLLMAAPPMVWVLLARAAPAFATILATTMVGRLTLAVLVVSEAVVAAVATWLFREDGMPW